MQLVDAKVSKLYLKTRSGGPRPPIVLASGSFEHREVGVNRLCPCRFGLNARGGKCCSASQLRATPAQHPIIPRRILLASTL